MVGLLLMAPVPNQSTKPRQRQSPPWVLEGLNAVEITPRASIRAAAQKYDGLRGEPFKGAAADLNGDDIDDYILQGDREVCGTGGCPYAVVDGASAAPIGLIYGNPVVVRAQSTRGFLDIETYSHGSATSGSFTSYAFDGSQYVARSTRQLRGGEVKELFSSLDEIPRWQPAP
jgi:hypothetical protein